jgi:hypothetical protein
MRTARPLINCQGRLVQEAAAAAAADHMQQQHAALTRQHNGVMLRLQLLQQQQVLAAAPLQQWLGAQVVLLLTLQKQLARTQGRPLGLAVVEVVAAAAAASGSSLAGPVQRVGSCSQG